MQQLPQNISRLAARQLVAGHCLPCIQHWKMICWAWDSNSAHQIRAKRSYMIRLQTERTVLARWRWVHMLRRSALALMCQRMQRPAGDMGCQRCATYLLATYAAYQ